MAENQPPPPNQDLEIPLNDIDALLASEDPEFSQSLEEVRSVAPDQDTEIEASAIDEALSDEEKFEQNEPKTLGERLKARFKLWWLGFRVRTKARLRAFAIESFVFLKTKPKETALFLFAQSKILSKKALVPIRAFQAASRAERLAVLSFVFVALLTAVVLTANFKGVWLPQLNEPVLSSFEHEATSVLSYDPKGESEGFYTAFPQERFEFLFGRLKVNLRRTSEHPNPMGAFEVIVLVDSKDTAIELRDREVEFFDLLQRVFEEESFSDLESELGKGRLKSSIKREFNQKLTQGWVKDINFKTFVLKP